MSLSKSLTKYSLLKSIKVSSFLFLGGILLVHPSLFGFTLLRNSNGTIGMGWTSNNLIFDIDSSCTPHREQVYSAIERSVSVWNSVPTSSLKVSLGTQNDLPSAITTYVGSTASAYPPEGNPIVYCDSNFQSNSGEDADSIPGFATGQYISGDGKIKSCLLVLNIQDGADANILSMDATLVNNILAHEIGHCVGLGHSADPEALMYYATGPSRKTVLTKDDLDGVTYLYPQSEATSVFQGCSAIASSQNGPKRMNSNHFHSTKRSLLFFFGWTLELLLMLLLGKLILFLGRLLRQHPHSD